MSDDNIVNEISANEKTIKINGTNNRYQIKKLTKKDAEVKKRKAVEKWNIEEMTMELQIGGDKDKYLYNYENQLRFINKLHNDLDLYFSGLDPGTEKKTKHDKICEIIKMELNKKISSYKQQDIIKKIYEPEKFIDIRIIITKLIDCNLDCYYCREKMELLYEKVREQKQWTVDRVNNDIGHNKDNIVLACLSCNLKRRCKNSSAFVFTKQLHISKIMDTCSEN